MAEEELRKAHAALQIFGPRGQRLRELADLIVRACLDFSLEVPTNQAGRRHNDLLQAFENESVEEHQHEKNAGRKRYDRYRQKNILCFPHRDDRRVAQV